MSALFSRPGLSLTGSPTSQVKLIPDVAEGLAPFVFQISAQISFLGETFL